MFCVSSSRLPSVGLEPAIVLFSGHFTFQQLYFTVNKDNETDQTAGLYRLFGAFAFSV